MSYNYVSQTAGTAAIVGPPLVPAVAPVGDLTNALGNPMLQQLLSGGAGVIDQSALDAVVYRAEADVDSYLNPQYTTPVVTKDWVVRSIAIDLAISYAYDRKPEFLRDGKSPWKDRFSEAVKKLEMLRKGQIKLNVEGSQQPANVATVIYATSTPFILDNASTDPARIGNSGW